MLFNQDRDTTGLPFFLQGHVFHSHDGEPVVYLARTAPWVQGPRSWIVYFAASEDHVRGSAEGKWIPYMRDLAGEGVDPEDLEEVHTWVYASLTNGDLAALATGTLDLRAFMLDPTRDPVTLVRSVLDEFLDTETVARPLHEDLVPSVQWFLSTTTPNDVHDVQDVPKEHHD
jgi:hypothetical protein